MRHYKKGRKLGTDASHTKAIKKNLLVNLFTNDRIKTIESRAKEVRGDVDRVITWAKKGDLHSRRLAIALVGDKELVREVFEKAAQGMWADRNGGYTRIMKLGPRKGDNAPIVILELVTEVCVPKSKRQADEKVKAAKKADKPAKAKKEKAAEDTASEDEAAKQAAAEAPAEEAAAEKAAEAEAQASEDKAEDATTEAADVAEAAKAADAEESAEEAPSEN